MTSIEVELRNVGPFSGPTTVLKLDDRLTVYRGPGKTTLCRAVAGCLNPDRNRLGTYGTLSRGMVSAGQQSGSVWVGDANWSFYDHSDDLKTPGDVRTGTPPFDIVLGYGVERRIGTELHDFGYGQLSDFGPLFDDPVMRNRARLTSPDVWMIKEECILLEVPNFAYVKLKAALCRLLGVEQIRVGRHEMNFHFGDRILSTRQLSHSEQRIVGLLCDIAQKVGHFNKPKNGLCIIDGHNVGLSTEKAHQVLDEAMVLWPELSFLVTEY